MGIALPQQNSTDSTLWTGTLSGLDSATIASMRFLVQAVNGVGLVSLDDNQGSYYQADEIAPALQVASPALTSTSLQLTTPPSSAAFGATAGSRRC